MRPESRPRKVSQLVGQGKLSIGDGYRAKNSELSRSGLPFARAGNIDGGFNFEDADCFPEADLRKVGEKVSKPGDVVFTSKGTVGRFAFVRESTRPFVFSPQLCYWRSLDVNSIHPRYLLYWMHGEEFWLQADAVKGQTDMADYVSLTDQRMMSITLPPIDEQRAIAEVLGALDDKIELNRQMNHTLEEMASALFKSWFIDFDPVVAKAEGREPFGMDRATAALFPASLNGELPTGWTGRVGEDFYSIDKGVSYKGEFLTDAGKPMINLGCFLGRGRFRAERIKGYAGEYKPRHVVRPGDIVMANTDMTQERLILGSPCVVPDLGAEAAFLFSHHVFAVRLRPDAPAGFREYIVLAHQQDSFRERAEGFSNGTTVLGMPADAVLGAPITFPGAPLIAAFAGHAAAWRKLREANERESRTLTTLRDALLPKLLSGEIRLQNAEKLVGAVL